MHIIMKPTEKDTAKKREEDKDDATKPSTNIEKGYAHEINRGDAKSKTYKGEGGKEPQGPNYNKESKNVDGDTTVNAGVFK
jgi:hypothetical protein